MGIRIIKAGAIPTMEPLTCCRDLQDIPIAGITLFDRLQKILDENFGDIEGEWRSDLWPSAALLEAIKKSPSNALVIDSDGTDYAMLKLNSTIEHLHPVQLDADSIVIKYPWDILAINEQLVGQIRETVIEGTVRDGVHIDGTLIVGKGSVLLPGVYIEGNVIIGENCKIGPNCYIRGNTYIGNKCHIGQAVEIKNSLLMDHVSAGHLSYIGDSVICPDVNLGAGTISSNLRHDGKNHRSTVAGKLIETGRRKFGTIIGDNVHTGIHTSIYPARKIWAGQSTLPGEVVSRDIRPE